MNVYLITEVPLRTCDDKTSGTVMKLVKETQYSLQFPTFNKGRFIKSIICDRTIVACSHRKAEK